MDGRKRNPLATYVPVYVRARAPQRPGRYTAGEQEDRPMTTMMPEEDDQPRTDGKLVGRVTALQREKSFGFIAHAMTGEDYFFHKSECLAIWDTLEKYETVVFIPAQGPKGRRALQVERLPV